MHVDKKFETNGKTNNKVKAKALIEQIDTPEKFEAGMADLKKYWDKLLGILNVDTPDDKVNRMVNIWNQYQCMVTFNLSRSASYFESGIGRGMGFRDSNQDILGSYTRFLTEQKKGSSTSLPPSSLMVAAITSISLLPRRVMQISVAISPMIRSG